MAVSKPLLDIGPVLVYYEFLIYLWRAKMKRLSHLTVLMLASLLASLTLACNLCGLSLPGGDSPPKHFENDEFSFDYPGDWQTFSEMWSTWGPSHDKTLDAEELVGMALSGYSRSFRLERKDLPPDSTLKEVYEQSYQNSWIREYVEENTISEGTTTVDGVTAYEKVYKRPHGEPWYTMREIWLEKDGRIYILSCWAYPNAFDEAQEDFNLIIESFHVK
ncbi:MAG: hypothetical protein MUP04_04755 [Anaerolineae bacterium]|nr:hypothetical protein [Anaerolineae bacterium]